ncbi:MAG TPA: acetyl-CoA carboxylase biotin carboxyl carrier protein, partial [bacterium]|nr:acetyl-CoA carboxylase biotin carboxyl carrier protein [bacterium]
MELKEIKQMIEMMKENDITELELEKDGLRVVLKKGGGQGRKDVIEYVHAAPPQAPAAAPQAAPAPAAAPEPAGKFETIKSPMVGTFYRAPSPESAPFVARGQVISPDDVVCIIEAMKVMNEIKAETKGKIVEILVE